MTEADKWGAIYRKLQQIDENKKRRRRHPKQLDLEVWIKEYEKKELKNG